LEVLRLALLRLELEVVVDGGLDGAGDLLAVLLLELVALGARARRERQREESGGDDAQEARRARGGEGGSGHGGRVLLRLRTSDHGHEPPPGATDAALLTGRRRPSRPARPSSS